MDRRRRSRPENHIMQLNTRSQGITPLLILGLALASASIGCNATNDNPIDANKMQEIRKKESDQRKNFNPQTANPGQSTPSAGR